MYLFLTLLISAAAARAEYAILDNGEVQTFTAIKAADLPADTVQYSYRTVLFDQWAGAEKKSLNLFPSYQPSKKNPLIMYVAKVSFILKKSASVVDLRPFLNLKLIQALDQTIQQKALDPADVITYKEGRYAPRNPPPPKRWCEDPTRSACLLSHFTLPAQYQYAFAVYETGKGSPYKTLEGQSEIRIANAGEIQNAADLKQLTGIPTAPSALLVQNTFWFTHAIEFIKVLGIVQPVPGRDDDSIVTGYMAFAIEKKTWDMAPLGFPIRDVILGKGGNTKDGILSGLPKLTQHLALSLADTFAH